jgi:hypothetical protein
MTSAHHDLTITTRHSFGEHESDTTAYIAADRRREEHQPSQGHRRPGRGAEYVLGPRMASITRCDLGMGYRLNLDDREYDCGELPRYPTQQQREASPPPERANPTVRVETTTVDTGERKQAFGFMARRVITTRRHIPLSEACSDRRETRTDGWYVDLDPRVSCERAWTTEGRRVHAFLSVRVDGEPLEIPQFKDIGEPETGFAIEVDSVGVSHHLLPDGTTKEFRHLSKRRVTSLSTEPLDPALFEVPPGFRKVESVRQNPKAPLVTRLIQRLKHPRQR